MTQIHSYLTFNGNCREAMTFYQECLGGVLTFQTLGDSPFAKKMPNKMKDCILHATLTKDALVLQATDMVPPAGYIQGNTMSLSLNCSSKEELLSTYDKLAADGSANHPIEDTYWGTLFGDLTDKYGHQWLLNYGKII